LAGLPTRIEQIFCAIRDAHEAPRSAITLAEEKERALREGGYGPLEGGAA
jgi:hypothetical protein